MPKMKTRKAVVARFKLTATGKLKKSQSGRRHKATCKTPKRKRQLRAKGLVDAGQLKVYKRMMGV